MSIQPGDRIPEATLTVVTDEGPRPTPAAEFFGGKRVALFAVPGAFTPTCSARHLPGFKDKAADLKAKGVDTIACLSVNDAFVMKAWAKDQGITDEGVMLADGSGDFAKALGLDADFGKFGMGLRAQRFAMVVNDGVVERLDVEAPGEFRVSSAEYMLEQL
ncbi:MAG: redoxin family protein [Caulobacteraceae bacterium]